MRIISGTSKGKRLVTPKGRALRPTSDRVKESIFNILGGVVEGKVVLDLFAGTGNLGINYDTANLILYGKANPLDGLDVVGKYIKSLHAKDGFYPTNPRELGREVPIGQGKVDFPKIIRKLREMNFKGHITIEREISGPQQVEDILQSKKYLEELIKTV